MQHVKLDTEETLLQRTRPEHVGAYLSPTAANASLFIMPSLDLAEAEGLGNVKKLENEARTVNETNDSAEGTAEETCSTKTHQRHVRNYMCPGAVSMILHLA